MKLKATTSVVTTNFDEIFVFSDEQLLRYSIN